MTEENGEKKGKELESIFVGAWSDWSGGRASRDVRTGDEKSKFTVGLPIPKTDEESQDLYGVDLAFLIEKGVKQHSYDSDTNLGNKISDWLKVGADMKDKAGDVAGILETDMIYSPKEKKAGEASKLKAAKAELNMSLDEMVAFVKAHQK